jgi:hypothetical protein
MATYVSPEDHVELRPPAGQPNHEAHSSGVSWGAVIGGAFAASALYLILLALGAGFGLSAVSPWSNTGASASTVGAVAIIWLIIIEILASACGGYLTGRLRTKWTFIHTDEVFFRDTANGFLAWAVALVVSVAFLASAGAWMAGSEVQAAASQQAATGATTGDPSMYFADALFRSDRTLAEPGDPVLKAEAAQILARDVRQNPMTPVDQSYLAQLVARRTGMSQHDAEQRVTSVMNQARQAADTTRKATAHLLLWLFLAMLIGAFSASYAATIGGRQRDHLKAV